MTIKRDVVQWYDIQDRKVNLHINSSISHDFEHKISKESLWLHGRSCIDQEVRKRGLQTIKEQGHLFRNEYIFSIVDLLKACAEQKELDKGSKLHAYIQEHEVLAKNCYVVSSLISMYAKCGAVAKAQQVFSELPVHDVITWNTLIGAYAQQGQGEEALKCFDNMLHEGHSPNAVSFTCALKACKSIGAVAKGEQIYDKIVHLGMLEKDVVLGSTLVDMYAKFGSLTKAQSEFDKLSVRNVVTWTSLIAGYAQHGQGEEALKCFDNMQHEGHSPNVVTFTYALKACGSTGAATKGEKIHNEIVSLGMLKKDIMLGGALVDMYAKCGALVRAQQVLSELPVQNTIMWNALIAGYVQQGQSDEALDCFDRMQHQGQSPNAGTYISALKACGSIGAVSRGSEVHDKIVSLDLLERDVMLGNTLVDMYIKCGAFAKAQAVFDELPVRNVVTWSALIAGYAQEAQGEEALKYLDCMQHEGHSPDVVTLVCALKACASIGAGKEGEHIHKKIVSLGMFEKDTVLGSSLVDMYASCGELTKAQQVINKLSVRHVVAWTALITGYTKQGQGEEALNCFDNMQRECDSPDGVIFTCALKACGSVGAFARGRQIHNQLEGTGLWERNMALGSTLVDMYVKCAALVNALKVFQKLPVQDVVTWNAVIGGYAQHGKSGEALNCFQIMQTKGVSPNSTTLICLLSACRHSGLFEEAKTHLSRMTIKYGLLLDVEHYSCIIDLFGRAGKFNLALGVIEKMSSASLPVWLALLGACHKWREVRIGRLAFNYAVCLDKNDGRAYVCMANIYTAAGMYEESVNIEELMVINKAWKMPGCWWCD